MCRLASLRGGFVRVVRLLLRRGDNWFYLWIGRRPDNDLVRTSPLRIFGQSLYCVFSRVFTFLNPNLRVHNGFSRHSRNVSRINMSTPCAIFNGEHPFSFTRVHYVVVTFIKSKVPPTLIS